MSQQIPLQLPLPSYEDYERYKIWIEEQQKEQRTVATGSVIIIDLVGQNDGFSDASTLTSKKN
jgi:hypothetical protein